METSKTIQPNPECFDPTLLQLSRFEDKYNDYEFPKVSIVIPVYNCAQSIATTIESLLIQDYPDYEVVIVDGGSTDRTLEVIKGYKSDKIHIYSTSAYARYEMLNKGISQSSGTYVNFLFPGDFYIYKETLKHMMSVALDHDRPSLVYCGTLLRDGKTEVKVLHRHLSLKLLRKGQQPTSLQSIWFKSETFRELGKFNTSLHLRGGYEMMCRFCLHKGLRSVSTNRVFTDYDLRWVTKRLVIRHFWETLRTIHKYFGSWDAVRWFFFQKDTLRFVKLWFRSVKVAFLGR